MIPALSKLTRELWGAVQLTGFLLMALVVFCTVPMRGTDKESCE